METIQIAPSTNDFKVTNGRVYEVDFNGLHVKYELHDNVRKPNAKIQEYIKKCICEAIALSSKSWQVIDLLNRHFSDGDGEPYGDVTITPIQ